MRHVWVIVGIVSFAAPAWGDDSTLTLEGAIHLALTKNERAAIADLNVVISDASVDKARVAFLPVLTANGNDQLRPRDKPVDTAQGSLQLSQPLIVPTAFPLYSEAKHNLAAQIAQSTDDKRTLSFDAAKAFFNVLLASEVVKAAERELDTAKADLADADAQSKAQIVSTNDVTRAQISVAGSEREVASDRGQLQTAYVQLSLLVNQRIQAGLAQPTTVLDASQKPLPPVEKLVGQSLAKRPDLVAKKQSAIASHDFASEPHYRIIPSLVLSGQLSATSNSGASGHDVDAVVELSAQWNIWDGTRSADEKSRDAQAAIADLDTDALGRTIDAQVRTAAAQLVSSQQAMQSARSAMEASQKSASETAVLYKQGLAKAIELIDANNQRFTAEVAYAEAQFTVATAYLSLRQAMGLDPIGTELQ
jgi:outer membrane protein TolC